MGSTWEVIYKIKFKKRKGIYRTEVPDGKVEMGHSAGQEAHSAPRHPGLETLIGSPRSVSFCIVTLNVSPTLTLTSSVNEMRMIVFSLITSKGVCKDQIKYQK